MSLEQGPRGKTQLFTPVLLVPETLCLAHKPPLLHRVIHQRGPQGRDWERICIKIYISDTDLIDATGTATRGLGPHTPGACAVKQASDFPAAKRAGRRITVLTAYDAWSARLLAETDVDALLVGDSVAMVVHGLPETFHATLDMLEAHTAAVRRGAGPERCIIADLPFPEHRLGPEVALRAAHRLLKAGAQAVKLENVRGHTGAIAHLVESGIPVMGHLGFTPQSVHQLGGPRVQARGEAAAAQLLDDARQLEALGCFGLVLELIPRGLAQAVTEALAIPTIGIGAGPHCDGQVLVLQDMLGLNPGFRPRFLRTFADGAAVVRKGVAGYVEAVRAGQYPSDEESHG